MATRMSHESKPARPNRQQAEDAVRVLLRWAGEDPDREGLVDTPARVVRAYEDWFSGYDKDPVEYLTRTFKEVDGYDELVVLRDIEVISHCEHHMVPVIGKAHLAYMPNGKVVGISKLARVVDAFAKRLQTQETMTAQIADAIEQALDARGVALIIDAEHQCMTTRGVKKPGVSTITTQFRGVFAEDKELERRFWEVVKG